MPEPRLGRTGLPNPANVGDRVHVGEFFQKSHTAVGVPQCLKRYSTGVRFRHRHAAQAFSLGGIPHTEDPPATVERHAQRGVVVGERVRTPGQPTGVDLGSVHPDLDDREPTGGRGGIQVRVGEPVGEAFATLRQHRESIQARTDLVSARSGIEVAGQRDGARRGRCPCHHIQRVQQRRRGDLGGFLIAQGGGKSSFRKPGHRGLGDDQQAHLRHEIARQKSHAAIALPRTEPLTFDVPPVRGP